MPRSPRRSSAIRGDDRIADDNLNSQHRFGSTLNAHLHFHCAIIDRVFEPAAGVVVFHANAGLDATAITQAKAQVRRRALRTS